MIRSTAAATSRLRLTSDPAITLQQQQRVHTQIREVTNTSRLRENIDVRGGTVAMFVDQPCWDLMLQEISNATFVDMIMSEFVPGRACEQMIAALQHRFEQYPQFRVRILLSATTGGILPCTERMAVVKRLRRLGIEVQLLKPRFSRRALGDHRKVMITNMSAWCGSFTVRDDNVWGTYHDGMFRYQGAIHSALHRVWHHSWRLAGGGELHSETASLVSMPGALSRTLSSSGVHYCVVNSLADCGVPAGQRALYEALFVAEQSIDLQVTYLDDDTIIDLLRQKARSGVQVRLILPHDRDWFGERLFDWTADRLRACIEDGMSIYIYPEYLHLKTAIIDAASDSRCVWTSTGNVEGVVSPTVYDLSVLWRGRDLVSQSGWRQLRRNFTRNMDVAGDAMSVDDVAQISCWQRLRTHFFRAIGHCLCKISVHA